MHSHCTARILLKRLPDYLQPPSGDFFTGSTTIFKLQVLQTDRQTEREREREREIERERSERE